MEIIIELLTDALSWLCIAALGWLCVQVKGIVKHTKLMEQSNKALMRESLLNRYRFYKENGNYCTLEHKTEFCSDLEIYNSLHGSNGVLSHAKSEVLNMAEHRPPEAEPDTLF